MDTSGSAYALTLPASPSIGDEVTILDQKRTFDTNNLTINRNGENIQGAASNLVVSTVASGFTLVYSGDATAGWLKKHVG